MVKVANLEEYTQIEDLIFKSPIVQTLLDERIKPLLEEYDVRISVPIKKQFVDKGKLIIAGYASVEIIDSQKELIPLKVLQDAWDKFSKDEDFMIGTLMHSNIPVIKILMEYEDSKGELWKSGVDDNGLFVVAVVNDGIEKGKQTRELIEKGKLAGFSIGGEALASSVHCDGKCFTRIDEMELHEIAVVDKPANKASVFTIVKRLKKENGIPKDDVQRAKEHYKIPDQVWDDMTEEDRQRFIDKLPNRGSRKKGVEMTAEEIKARIRELIKERERLSEELYPKSKLTEGQRKVLDTELEFIYSEIKALESVLGEKLIQKSKEVKKSNIIFDFSKLDEGIARLIGKPFAGYKDFADCVRQNQDAKDPDAYCGSIQAQVEGKKKSECGCPVEETITAKSIKKLDKSLSLLDNIQKKNLKR